jgi:predicted ABC-class ATPase
MKITRKRIREIVKETLDKKLVEQEPRQTSAGAQVGRELGKATNLKTKMQQVDTQKEYIEQLNDLVKLAKQGMKNPRQAQQFFRQWATKIANDEEFWGS